MITTAVRRARRSALTTVIALGLVATLAVDIAQAATGESTPSVASLEHRYLTQLRPIALQMHNAMTPAETVISAITVPHAGDAYAARDALIHGDALTGLVTVRAHLQSLKPPAVMAKSQRDLLAAAAMMETALRAVRPLAAMNGLALLKAINKVSDGNLALGAGEWQVALDRAYASEASDEPSGLGEAGGPAPASRTAWIFHADRTCSAASYLLPRAIRLESEHTLSGDEAAEAQLAHMLSWTYQRLASQAKPAGAEALPAQLLLRLRTLAFSAKLFGKLRAGIGRQDFGKIDRLINQLDQVQATLRELSTGLNRYGARSCGLIIGQWAGKGVSDQSRPSRVSA